ncbi:hypothetical protein ACGFWI_29865 [Streptomyces sp. NPDC048434]|uniref:hypothetical protein n=1 Tax=Streptomyces sp. NPDC048434 TaxID=3365549 RepID=UPI00371BE12D
MRSEGSAGTTPAPKGAVHTTPSPTSTAGYQKVDAVKLVKDAPKIGPDVKKSLAEPCAADEYPVEVTYAPLTGRKTPDVIVNVMTCADSVGIGAYVFRRREGAPDGYDTVYSNEQPSVYAGVNKGRLEVSEQTYAAGDKVCCPSGEDVTTYQWADGRFSRRGRPYHTDYSTTTDDGATPDDGKGTEG